jgi:dolichol-phosphate mannosyltransferase
VKIVIIIPTYNESENIEPLIKFLQHVFIGIAHEMHVLVVDDNSPDGTGEIVERLRQKYSNVHLLSDEKAGLGAAYIRGMTFALTNLSADAVMEMDADFSHKPEDVPRLVEELEKGYDFVIGSRYVKGGSIPDNWGFIRRMNSRWGNIFARYVGGLSGVRDCTAGFRGIRSSLLSKIDLRGLNVRGYAFQMALLHRAVCESAKVAEVPVDFIDRTRGETKLGLKDIMEFMLHAWWIRFETSKTFLRFGIVGASGVLVNLGLFTLLLKAGIDKFLASPIAIEVSIISNFFLNNYWTFSTRTNQQSIRLKGLKFNIVSVLALLISYFTFVALSFIFPKVPPQVHQAAGIVPATCVNYLLNSYWTFKESPSGDAA